MSAFEFFFSFYGLLLGLSVADVAAGISENLSVAVVGPHETGEFG